MPPASDSALALAGQLRSLADPELAGLLVARGVTAAGIHDFFDLADALLEPDSVDSALSRLPRGSLIALGVAGELGVTTPEAAAARLAALGGDGADLRAQLLAPRALGLLLERDGVLSVPAAVTRRLLDWPQDDLPDLAALIATPAPTTLSPVGRADAGVTDRASAERAFATVVAVAEVVAQLEREPARELARGGIALPDNRRLAASAGIGLDDVPALLEIAERGGLVARGGGEVAPTADGLAWRSGDSAERWRVLASAWLERMPDDVRTILRERAGAEWGDPLADYLGWLYPAGGDWIRERLATALDAADALGITHDEVPSTPGSLLLAGETVAAQTAMGELLPAEVERVYLQRDLSIVAPGPLQPRIDARLRVLADADGGTLASSYRVTTDSLNRAIAEGETADSLREFLGGIALSGIPQPLDYLITEAAQRHGLVRVAKGAAGSVVRSPDAALLRTLLADQALAALGLGQAEGALTSRFAPEVVFWSLAEARYPVAAEDARGRVVLLDRPRRDLPAPAPRADPLRELVQRLRLAGPRDAEGEDRAWLVRQIEVAVRGRLGLTVTVTMPDGRSVDYQLEPASLAGGRLRARDRRTDLERTLPLSSITAVAPALPE